MKKPFVVFGFLLTLFVSAIFGDYAISRGDFSPRAEASMGQKLQQSFNDFLAGVSGILATQPAVNAEASRSDVARVATLSASNENPSTVAANASSASRAPARDLSGAAHARASSSGLALGLGGDGAAGSFGATGGGGSASAAASSGSNARGGSAATEGSTASNSGSGAVDAPGGGGGGGASSDNAAEANRETRGNASNSERNNSERNPPERSDAPSSNDSNVTTPLDELFDHESFDPIVENPSHPLNPVTEYLGAAPNQTGANPSWLSEQQADKAAAEAAPVQAAAVNAAQVPDVSGTIGLLVLPLLGLAIMRRRRA